MFNSNVKMIIVFLENMCTKLKYIAGVVAHVLGKVCITLEVCIKVCIHSKIPIRLL